MEARARYADYAGSTIDDGFDYTHGRDLWIEKLDYTKNWLAAHISDAQARTSAVGSLMAGAATQGRASAASTSHGVKCSSWPRLCIAQNMSHAQAQGLWRAPMCGPH